eukprot:gene19015-24835_t
MLENHSKSLSTVLTASNDLTFYPFDDDPFCNVVHLTKYLWKHVKSLSNFGFRLLKCASQQLQDGIYAPVKDSPEPSFTNPQGYSIFRYKCRLSSHYNVCEIIESNSDSLTVLFNDPKLDIPSTDNEMIFIWYIVNVKLHSVYYYCPTSEPWGLPPAFGWLCASLGTNPPPEVQLCELTDTNTDSSQLLSGQTSKSFPLSSESFRIATKVVRPTRPSSAKKVISLKRKQAPIWDTGSTTNVLESAPVVTLRMEDRNNSYTPLVSTTTENAAIQTAISRIRSKAESSIRLYSIEKEIIPQCDTLNRWTSNQSTVIFKRRNWLNDATLDDLIAGCPHKLLDSSEVQIESEPIDEEALDKTNKDFESRWNLETIISKLHVHAPVKEVQPLAIEFSTLLSAIFNPNNSNDASANPEEDCLDSARDPRPSPEEFFDMCVPRLSMVNHFVQVQFLGVEMWPPVKVAQANGYLERLNYVIRISLNESRVSSSSDSALSTSFESDVSGVSEFIHRESTTSGNVSQTLPSGKKLSPFASVRSELLDRLSTRSLLSHRRVFTVHKDLTSICALHTELQKLFSETDIQAPPFPDPYDIADCEETIINKLRVSENSPDALDKKKLRFGQPFNYSLMSGLVNQSDPILLEGTDELETGMYKLQQYLEDVFALVEEVEDMFLSSGSSLGDQLGRLLASFLESSETEDLADFRRVFQLIPDRREMDNQGVSIILKRPLWFGQSSGGLSLRLLYDGLSLNTKSEDELLRLQKNKCVGCGQPLSSSFFGLQKNYLLCKFTGALFCRRWCHGDDRRILPHRMLSAWDSSLQRVCRIAAEFLDIHWSQPLTDIGRVNALLYEGVPALRQIKLYRRSIAALIDRALNHPTHITPAYDVVTAALGPDRLHLCACVSYYSMQDLIEVQSGVLLQRLVDLYSELRAIIPRKNKSESM